MIDIPDLTAPQGDRLIPRLMMSLAASGTPVEVRTVSLSRPTIEDVFIKLTGRTIREEEVSDRERMRRRGFGPGRGGH
jgi:ABC-2 type transport system ATP-binding protein